MRREKEAIRNRIVKRISLFLCLVLAVSNLQITWVSAAVGDEGKHYLTPYQTSGYDIYDNDELRSFNMMAVEYYQGVLGAGNTSNERVALYNLNGDFTSVSFIVGHLDDERGEGTTLNVYTDNELVKEIPLSGDMTTQTITIDTTDVQQLKFSGYSNWGRYGVANVIGEGGHVYESEVTKIATVKQDGVKTYTCKYCEYEYTETIEARVNCNPLLQPYQSPGVIRYVNDEASYFNVMGERYYDGIVGAGNTSDTKEAFYNLAQHYSEVTFTVGHLDDERWESTTLYVYSDGTQQKEIPLVGDMINQTVTVNTEGVTQLRIVLGSGWGRYAIFDMHYVTDLKSEHSFTEKIDEAGGIITYTCDNCGAFYMEPYNPEIKVTGITLDSSALEMRVGDTAKLIATVLPENATNQTVTWSSENSAVASVDKDGNVTAAGEGSTAIIATTEDGEFTARCEVTVSGKQDVNPPVTDPSDPPVTDPSDPVEVTEIRVSPKTLELEVGNTKRLSAAVLPNNATDKTVEWFSDDTSVATVDRNGLVRAVGKGNTVILATAGNGAVTAECEVIVTEKKQEEVSASLSLSTSVVTLYTGRVSNAAQITANVTGKSREVTWQSSDTTVARVSSSGRITAVSGGTAIVTATANGIQKTVRVTVKNPSITVKKSGKNVKSVTVKRKRNVKLSLDVKPAGSGISLMPLTKKQQKIASVRISGNKLVVVGKKKGNFKVKIKSGAATKSITIKVKR